MILECKDFKNHWDPSFPFKCIIGAECAFSLVLLHYGLANTLYEDLKGVGLLCCEIHSDCSVVDLLLFCDLCSMEFVQLIVI